MPQEPKPKKKRVPITALQKQQICIKKQDNSKLRDEDLAREYGLDRSTITKILKQREKWLAIDPNSNNARQKTQKSPKFPQIESELSHWLQASQANGEVVNDNQLQEKALSIAQERGVRSEFQASIGWITKFKSRHQMRNTSNVNNSGVSVPGADVSLQVNQQQAISGQVLSSTDPVTNFLNVSTNYTPTLPQRANGASSLSISPQSPYLYGASSSNAMGTFSPSIGYRLSPSLPHGTGNSLENSAFIFCDYQNDVLGMYNTSQLLNSFISRSRNLFRSVRQAKQKRHLTCISVGLCFRQGYPEISQDNQNLQQYKQCGRLVEGTKGSEFIEGLVPQEGDVIIKKRRLDAFYNTDLQMILESCNIKHIVLAGIDTSGVILTTVQSAADRDFRISVVRDCCFDGSEAAHKSVMEDVFPKYGVTVASFDGVIAMLRA